MIYIDHTLCPILARNVPIVAIERPKQLAHPGVVVTSVTENRSHRNCTVVHGQATRLVVLQFVKETQEI